MKRIFSKIRFLPLTIFAATLMLTVKIGDIWEGFDGLINGTIQVSEAIAQPTEEDTKPEAKDGQPAAGEKTAEQAIPDLAAGELQAHGAPQGAPNIGPAVQPRSPWPWIIVAAVAVVAAYLFLHHGA